MTKVIYAPEAEVELVEIGGYMHSTASAMRKPL